MIITVYWTGRKTEPGNTFPSCALSPLPTQENLPDPWFQPPRIRPWALQDVQSQAAVTPEPVPSKGKDSTQAGQTIPGCVTSGWGHSLSELQEIMSVPHLCLPGAAWDK